MNTTSVMTSFKPRKRKSDEFRQMRFAGIPHYPVVYPQDQPYSSMHPEFYPDDPMVPGYFSQRSCVPFVDPASSSSVPGSVSPPRWPMMPYPHRMHTLPSSTHASSYHSFVIPPPSSAPHYGYHIGHPSVIATQSSLQHQHSMSDSMPDPHY